MDLFELKGIKPFPSTGDDQISEAVTRILDSERAIENFLSNPFSTDHLHNLKRQIVLRRYKQRIKEV